MTNKLAASVIWSAYALLAFGPWACADPSKPHDSNTLHKWGNAIQYVVRKDSSNVSKTVHKGTNRQAVSKMGGAVQYTTRKDAQNLSIDTHNVENRNSVVHKSNGSDEVVKPLPKDKRKHLFQ